MSKSNPFDRLTSETNNIKHNKPKVTKINGTKIEMDHPIYATKHNKSNKDTNHNKNKKASDDKTTYSSVRITSDTSIKLHALLKASSCKNRNQLINDMISVAKPVFLDNNNKRNKYKKTYQLLKDFKAKAKNI